MKTLFITWSILALFELAGWTIITTTLLMDGIKYLQTKIHSWANQ